MIVAKFKGIKEELRKPDVENQREMDETQSSTSNNLLAGMNEKIVYYICGYANRKFGKGVKACTDCARTISVGFEDLPQNFTALHLTLNKDKGGLIYSSTSFFKLIAKVEKEFLHFLADGNFYKHNSFADFLYTFDYDTLPKVGCSSHQAPFMTNLMYDYVILRFKAVAKDKRKELCDKLRADKHSKGKQSRL